MIKIKVHRELAYETKDYYFYCPTVHSAFKTAYHHLRAMKNLMIDFKTPGTIEVEFIYGSNKIILKLNAAKEIGYRRNTDPYWRPLIEAKQKQVPLKTRIKLGLYHTRRISHGKKKA